MTLSRGESLSQPTCSLTLLSTINFLKASWCAALRGKLCLLQAEPSGPFFSLFPSPGESWRGASGAVLEFPEPALTPRPGHRHYWGAQNMKLLRHPSPHYPITFTPFIFLLFQKTGVRQGKAENFFRSSLGPTPVSILLKTMIYHTILYSTVQYHAIPYGQTITLPSARFKC